MVDNMIAAFIVWLVMVFGDVTNNGACTELQLHTNDAPLWLSIVRYDVDSGEDLEIVNATIGLVAFVVVNDAPYGVYINMEGCIRNDE